MQAGKLKRAWYNVHNIMKWMFAYVAAVPKGQDSESDLQSQDETDGPVPSKLHTFCFIYLAKTCSYAELFRVSVSLLI